MLVTGVEVSNAGVAVQLLAQRHFPRVNHTGLAENIGEYSVDNNLSGLKVRQSLGLIGP